MRDNVRGSRTNTELHESMGLMEYHDPLPNAVERLVLWVALALCLGFWWWLGSNILTLLSLTTR